MLNADEIAALRDASIELTQPIIDYLLRDLAERISTAGQFTATAQYETWKLQQLGLSQKEIKKRLEKLLKASSAQIEQLMTQSAEVGYNFDLKMLPTAEATPFEKNAAIQRIVSAAITLAQDDLTNITQTLGMVDPWGNTQPLQAVYRECMDYAFMQVSTGAADYNTAIRQATKNLAEKGVCVIDYESGVHTSLEAAVRRNVMGGLGLMQEQISKQNHDDMGADGWEIDAHNNSAPDHEPIQGRQYPDAEYEALNNSLVRRIGTLNCGHSAYPIIMGVNKPQYTDKQLEAMRTANADGVEYNGKHYTGYEATQRQRVFETAMRKQKRRILIDEATGDAEKLQTDQIKLQRLRQEYARFSKAAGLRMQNERAEVAGFSWKQAGEADKAYKKLAKTANSMYDIGSEEQNVKAYLRDLPIRKKIGSEDCPLILRQGRQKKHIPDTNEFKSYAKKLRQEGKYGPSRVTVGEEAISALVQKYHGTGILLMSSNGKWREIERITVHPENIGIAVNNITGVEADTTTFTIRYSKDGFHIAPDYPSRKGDKAKK